MLVVQLLIDIYISYYEILLIAAPLYPCPALYILYLLFSLIERLKPFLYYCFIIITFRGRNIFCKGGGSVTKMDGPYFVILYLCTIAMLIQRYTDF